MAARKIRNTSSFRQGGQPVSAADKILKDDLATALRQQDSKFPFSNGVMLDVEFTASALTKTLAHKLDGQCAGFILLDLNAPEQIHRQAVTTSSLATTHIELVATGACKAKVWVWR